MYLQNREYQWCRYEGHQIQFDADRHADSGDSPDRRRRRNAADGRTFPEDNARAEKADARHDVCHDTVGSEHFVDAREERGAYRDKRHRAQPSHILAAITLPSNDAAADRGEEEFTKEFGLLRRVYRRLQSAYQARDELEDERRIDAVD